MLNPLQPIIELGTFWLQGEAHKYYNTSLNSLHHAVLKSLKELDLKVSSEQTKKDVIYLTAGDKSKFHIRLKTLRPNTTDLAVRVNAFGDKQYAELFYRHVDHQPGVKQFATLEELTESLR